MINKIVNNLDKKIIYIFLLVIISSFIYGVIKNSEKPKEKYNMSTQLEYKLENLYTKDDDFISTYSLENINEFKNLILPNPIKKDTLSHLTFSDKDQMLRITIEDKKNVKITPDEDGPKILTKEAVKIMSMLNELKIEPTIKLVEIYYQPKTILFDTGGATILISIDEFNKAYSSYRETLTDDKLMEELYKHYLPFSNIGI